MRCAMSSGEGARKTNHDYTHDQLDELIDITIESVACLFVVNYSYAVRFQDDVWLEWLGPCRSSRAVGPQSTWPSRSR